MVPYGTNPGDDPQTLPTGRIIIRERALTVFLKFEPWGVVFETPGPSDKQERYAHHLSCSVSSPRTSEIHPDHPKKRLGCSVGKQKSDTNVHTKFERDSRHQGHDASMEPTGDTVGVCGGVVVRALSLEKLFEHREECTPETARC
jgi:hypothetical protein